MKSYGNIYTSFWNNEEIQALSNEAKLLAVYLLSTSHSNMLGCFRLPYGYVAEDLNWDLNTISTSFQELRMVNFAIFDKSGWVLICNYLKWNPVANPNQGKSIEKLFSQLPPKISFYPIVIENLFSQKEHLPTSFMNRLQTLSKGFRNQEQEQYQEQYQEQGQEKKLVLKSEVAESRASNKKSVSVALTLEKKPSISQPSSDESAKASTESIFEFWRQTMNQPNAKLDYQRRRYIQKAIKLGYTYQDMCNAIVGCANTPYNMGGNDRHEIFNGLHVIFRDAAQIDRFVKHYHDPPKQNLRSIQTQQNLDTIQNWINRKKTL